ncbi:MAG: hypothetical protein AB1689_01390 [Thermodesulfobacteriota bacterium]
MASDGAIVFPTTQDAGKRALPEGVQTPCRDGETLRKKLGRRASVSAMRLRTVVLCLAPALLLACGGGGGSGISQPTATPTAAMKGTPTPAETPSPGTELPPGSLDPDFGSDGVAFVDGPTSLFVVADVTLDAERRIVALLESIDFERENQRRFALLRLEPDGSPDLSFGDSGVVETAVASALGPCVERPCDDFPVGVLVLPDGRILASGSVDSLALAPDERQGVLVVYRSDGALDLDAGERGIRTPTFRKAPLFLGRLVLDGAGRVLAAGSSLTDFVVARFLGDLSPDPSFGSRGIAFAPPRADLVPGFGDVVPRGDGTIAAAGGSSTFGYARPEIARFDAGGMLDPSFGEGGFVEDLPPGPGVEGGAGPIAGDARGGLVAILGDGILARYTPDGLLDGTFAGTGFVTLDFDARNVFVQPEGRVLVLGNGRGSGGIIAAYAPSGEPDPTFGDSGRVALSVLEGQPAGFVDAVSDGPNALVVIGSAGDVLAPNRLFVARYLTEATAR